MADETGSQPKHPDATSGVSEAPAGSAFVALKSGLTIRHYIVEEVIGAGGFGITYRARHDRLKSKIFALKEFFPRDFAVRSGTHVISTRDGEGIFRWGLDRFLKEAEALAKCEHPGIVDVVDFFEENGTAYAVLGYVEGQQLGQWLDSLGRPPTQAELDRITMPLLDALEVVHGANLLHRDIAPDNIMIRRDGSPCLIDFGACREDIRDRSRKLSAIVKTGYSPPEQYHGVAELQGPWTDIYAVGATLYRAVAGHSPMDSSRRGTLGDGLKPVTEMAKDDYRPGFTAAIDTALRLKPEDRPQSVASWRSMLMSESPTASGKRDSSASGRTEATARVDNAASRSVSNIDEAPAARPARKGRAIAAGMAAIALATAGAYALWRSTSPSYGPIEITDPSGKRVTVQIPPPRSKEEADAEAAWKEIAATADIKAIERFLELHGKSRSAADAQQRLAFLRAEAARIDTERANAERAKKAIERAESAARTAWAQIRETGDPAEIERFLTSHGTTRTAEAARARLTEISAAKAVSQRAQDAAWATCQGAQGNDRVRACTPVIDSNDTVERRAAALQIRGNGERAAASYDKAIADFTRSLELVPGNAQVLTDRGVAHFLKGGAAGRSAALDDYNAAIRAAPRHAEALNNRAWALFQAGRAADALADANRSIEADATNGYAHDTRGQIREALGQRDEAIRDYERAIAIDPSQETSRTGLQRLRAGNK